MAHRETMLKASTYLTPEEHEALSEQAKRNYRSLAAELRARLLRTFEQDGIAPDQKEEQ